MKLYTLGTLAAPVEAAPLASAPTVIEVPRVTLPDYLDTEDIVVRYDNELKTSHRGRWASRLSLGATEMLVGSLARSRPDALVTDQPQTTAPGWRILINISRLDVATSGGAVAGLATLEADWQFIPRDAAAAVLRDRASLSAAGPVGTDQEVVALEAELLRQLAHSIDIKRLR